MKLLVGLLTLLSPLAPKAYADVNCAACDIVEKEGDDGLEKLKTLTPEQLMQKDKDQHTGFYWSIYHGQRRVRDFYMARISEKTLTAQTGDANIVSACASQQKCSLDNFRFLKDLGFPIPNDALRLAAAGLEECNYDKFLALLEFGAKVDAVDARGDNLLHTLVDRSRQGRPTLAMDCLVKAANEAIKRSPKLKTQTNNYALTPLEFLEQIRKHKAWGSIPSPTTHFNPLLKVLR